MSPPPYLLTVLTFDIIESLWSLLNHIHGIPCSCLVVQSCLTLCNLINFSLSGSCVHGIFQARILKWVAIFYSRTWNHSGCPCLITAIWYFAVPPTFCICVKFVNFHSSLCKFKLRSILSNAAGWRWSLTPSGIKRFLSFSSFSQDIPFAGPTPTPVTQP